MKRECELMSRILLDDQIVGECNEFLHKLQVVQGSRKSGNSGAADSQHIFI